MYENVELCFACRYFNGRAKYDAVLLEDVKGLCRAQPPVPQGDQLFRFPQVRASDWCGLWEACRSPIDEDLEALYESDRPKPAPPPMQEDPIDPESWWAAYECCGCCSAKEPFPATCFDVRFDGCDPQDKVTCPLCGTACRLKNYWNATSSGYGSRSGGTIVGRIEPPATKWIDMVAGDAPCDQGPLAQLIEKGEMPHEYFPSHVHVTGTIPGLTYALYLFDDDGRQLGQLRFTCVFQQEDREQIHPIQIKTLSANSGISARLSWYSSIPYPPTTTPTISVSLERVYFR